MAVQKKKRVTIENGLLSTMAANAMFVKEFQFLSRLRNYKPNKKAGCGSCSRATNTDAAIYNAAKMAIAGMSDAKKRQLKELLKAEQIAIHYTTATGKREDRFF